MEDVALLRHDGRTVSARIPPVLLSWSLWTLCALLIAASFVLDLLMPDFLTPPEKPGPILSVSSGLLSLACPTVGALVASRLPKNPIGWIFCGMGLLYGVRRLATAYAYYALLARPSLPGGEYAAWLSTWLGFSGLILLGVFLVLLFPGGRLPSRRWRIVAWTATAGTAMVALGDALRFGPLPTYYYAYNPFGVAGALPVGRFLDAMAVVGGTLLSAGCLAALVALVIRLRESRGNERRQLGWFSCAAVPALVGSTLVLLDRAAERFALLFLDETMRPVLLIADYLAPLIREDRVTGRLVELRVDATVELLTVAVLFVLPICTGVAILRHHLYDIDVLVNRTLVYATLTMAVIGFYVLVVAVFGALFGIGTGGNLVVSLLATGLIAVLFRPLQDRLQRAVNRLIYGERDDPYAALSRLGQRLEAALAPEAVLPAIVETVAQSLRLPYAEIELREGEDFRTAAVYGTPAGETVALPLVYQKEEIGRLVLSPRAANETLGPTDLSLLEDLARHARVAVHAVRLTSDLQRSRERLVATREEERRRLRRDLHDGLGPTLASLGLGLDAARKLMRREPDDVEALLVKLKEQTQEAVTDIRQLVYGLRPPALDDLGLVPAIRQQAEGYGFAGEYLVKEANGRDVGTVFSVEAPEDLPPLPAAVEVAAYRIAQEAMTNVARHARAGECRVRLSLAEGVLELEVSDDGAGFGRGVRAGVGLSSMRERTSELGGTLTVEQIPSGGTRVIANLPLPGSKLGQQGAKSWTTPSASS